ncbi:MAG: ADP-ribosylglycohydrolase family protein [Lentisphaeria bacterium]|nr:MAG: ADP-ribosylglycohydrolase family protein [Lentisphaeria bacterium]
MFGEKVPSSEFINRSEYRDKVLGCWTGKNIGGTLGAPMEGRREIFDVKFYVQDLKGKPAPNDDLDLQLIWLLAVEENGIYQVNERVLGEYWLSHITGPWNEYGVGKVNMANGLVPPLSGAFNNEQWKNSNGAWIRSEIWACLFPGAPDDALEFAWCDACVDHAGDGIYAELFTTAMESAAFVESDIRKLIDIALAKIPADCRVARSVGIAIREYEAGHDFKTARNAVVEDSADLGWFQAPANVAFAVIGLLYGEGDFGRSLCFAVNCGDDTDCTGATVGAVLGIVKGRSGIPAEWIEPIGETIRTVAIDPFHAEAPADLDELTERVIRCAEETQMVNPTLPRLTDGPTTISEKLRASLLSGEQVERRLWHKSSFAFRTAPAVRRGRSGVSRRPRSRPRRDEKAPAFAPQSAHRKQDLLLRLESSGRVAGQAGRTAGSRNPLRGRFEHRSGTDGRGIRQRLRLSAAGGPDFRPELSDVHHRTVPVPRQRQGHAGKTGLPLLGQP